MDYLFIRLLPPDKVSVARIDYAMEKLSSRITRHPNMPFHLYIP